MYIKSNFSKYIGLLFICLNLSAQKPLEISTQKEEESKIENLRGIIRSNPKNVNLNNKDIIKEILEKIVPDLEQCESLDLSNNQLTELPNNIGDLTNLKELYLWANQLTELPESIGNLTKLTKLVLLGNKNESGKTIIIKIPKGLDRKGLEIKGDYEFIVPINQKSTANIVILLDRNNQKTIDKPQDATQHDMDNAIDNRAPILVSGSMLKNYLERRKYIPDIYEIYKFKNSDLYLFLPRGSSLKNAFNLGNTTETTIQNLTDALDNWPNEHERYKSDNWLEGINSIFKKNTDYWWNIILIGHGGLNTTIAGLSYPDFKKLIEFLNSSDINIFFLFYDTCFGGGSTSVNIYKTMKGSITDIPPLKFMVVSGATRELSSYFIPTNFSDLFEKLQNLLNFEKLSRESRKNIGSDPIDGLLKIIKKNVIDPNLTTDTPLIKFKNTQFFIPIRKDIRVKVINNVLVKKHQLEKTQIKIDKTIKAIFVYPNIIKIPIEIESPNIPDIVSLDPGTTIHFFSEIKIKTQNPKIISDLFFKKGERGKIFIVKILITNNTKYENVVVDSENDVAYYKKDNSFHEITGESETSIDQDRFKKEIFKILQKNINLYQKSFPSEEITYIPVAPWKTEPKKLINYINKKLNIKILNEEELKIEKLRKIIQNNPENVNLSSKEITKEILEKIIPDLEQCESLYLSFNKLSSLPESIGNLVKLKTILGLANNQLSSLPESIGNLVNLTTLDLANNQLSSLPESIGNLVNLTALGLYSNQLSSLPESIGNLVNLTTLDLANNQLSSLPESIGNLVKLKTILGLANNQLSSLPESIGNLVNLTTLDLANNQLSSLPESIGNLVSLTGLGLANNQLSSLPESIGNLVNLTTLGLNSNQLSSLPKSIDNLVNLTTLGLANNQLSSLPESIGNLVSLTGLGLNSNQLSSLPESIGNLKKLEKLFLSKQKKDNKKIMVKIPEILNRKNLYIDGKYEFVESGELKIDKKESKKETEEEVRKETEEARRKTEKKKLQEEEEEEEEERLRKKEVEPPVVKDEKTTKFQKIKNLFGKLKAKFKKKKLEGDQN